MLADNLVNSVNIRPGFCSRPKVFCNLSSQISKSPLNISFYGRANTILSVRTVHKIGKSVVAKQYPLDPPETETESLSLSPSPSVDGVGLKPDEGDEGSKPEGGLKGYSSGSLVILKNVVTALPPWLWVLIVFISYAMAHSECDLYGIVGQAIWNKVRWWRKPYILTAEWIGIQFVRYYKYIRSVSEKYAAYAPKFVSSQLGKIGTVFWLAVLLRALSLAIPLTIAVLVWKMFCSLVTGEGDLEEYASGVMVILENVATALPLWLWALIVFISYAMAHSKRDLYGFVAQALWSNVWWWYKPKILTAEWNRRKFVRYYKYIRSVSEKYVAFAPKFVSSGLGKTGTVFWLAFLLRALSLAIPLTIVVLVGKMFSSFVKIVTGRF